MSDADPDFLSFDEAVKRLPDGDTIHTFRAGPGLMLGADHGRESLLEAMKKAETIHVAGQFAQALGHGLAIFDDHTSDLLEFAGPVGDLGKRALQAAGQLAEGNPLEAAKLIAPVASRNWEKGIDMATTGMYRDGKGQKVLDVTGFEAAMKAIGFQPQSVARVQEAAGEVSQEVGMAKLRKGELQGEMAKALFEKDQGAVAAVRAAVARWNENNPESRIVLSMPGVLQRLKAMREDRTQRMVQTAPAGMRAQVRSQMRVE